MGSSVDAIGALALLTLCYSALCSISPFGNCRGCGGFGFKVRQNRRGRIRRGRDCRRCRGYGKRIRVGRRLYNAVARLHHDGTR